MLPPPLLLLNCFNFVPFLLLYFYLYFFLTFFPSAAVAALLQLPLVTSNAGVAEAACGVVGNLADRNTENQAKLCAAGVCEGVCPLDACVAVGLGW